MIKKCKKCEIGNLRNMGYIPIRNVEYKVIVCLNCGDIFKEQFLVIHGNKILSPVLDQKFCGLCKVPIGSKQWIILRNKVDENDFEYFHDYCFERMKKLGFI